MKVEVRFRKPDVPDSFDQSFDAIATASYIKTGIDGAVERMRVFFLDTVDSRESKLLFFNPRIEIKDNPSHTWEDGVLYSSNQNEAESVFLSDSQFVGRCQIRTLLRDMRT